MKAPTKIRNTAFFVSCVALVCFVMIKPALTQNKLTAAAPQSKPEPCVSYQDDPDGCQPPTFATPTGQIPSRRVGVGGKIDQKSSEADARAGAKTLEDELHLHRNFTHVHWVVTVPSVKDPATGNWTGGDLDAMGDGRGLGVAGSCVYTGHANGPGKKHDINIFKIQSDPEKNPPIQVGTIPAMFEGNEGFDDRELRSLVYKNSKGEDMQILVRNGGTQSIGREMVYTVDMNTCLVKSTSDITNFGGQSHEFFMWHDPTNDKRVVVYVTIYTPGIPDANFPGLVLPDLYVLAVTDEDTGGVLKTPRVVGTFTLQDVGGPQLREKPDATGLFSDGRFLDFSGKKDLAGHPGNSVKIESNVMHSISVSNDGERAYVAGSSAGMYILNTEAVAHNKDVDLAAGKPCNTRSTIAAVNGVVNPTKISAIANDCVHMVVNDDPGLKAYLAGAASPEAKVLRYQTMLNRSRFDPYPPFVSSTFTHSAVIIPDRPAEVNGNTKNRPAYIWMADENGGCPLEYARIISVESEITPAMVGAFALPINILDNCLNQPITEPDGQQLRRPIAQQNHNPTVFKNLVFNGWYGHGLRAIDISNPMTPREVGYFLPVPQGIIRTYPVFKDGLIYYNDNRSGLHVLKYTGPRANELPGPGTGTYEGNATSPHR